MQERRLGGGVHDVATSGGAKERDRRSARIHRPEKVGADMFGDVFIREQLERARPIEASVVDQDVEFPVSSTDLLERGIDGVRIGDIGGDARYVTVELLGELVQPVGTSGQHEQRRALRGETPHDGLAGATGAAGDDGDLAG